MLNHWKQWARTVKRDAHALYLAARDPRVPWYAKGLAVAIAAYAASPIDLIPDFIPVVGYLDDLIIVPLGIALVIKLIPAEIIAEASSVGICRSGSPGKLDGRYNLWCSMDRSSRFLRLAGLPVLCQVGPLGGKAAHQRRGAADCGEYRQAAGNPQALM